MRTKPGIQPLLSKTIRRTAERSQTESAASIAAIRDGDEHAFHEFFLSMYPEVYSFLLRYTFRKEVAEDLAQDTFVRFWNSRSKLDPAKSIRGYLFVTARNLALNHQERDRVFHFAREAKDDVLIHLAQHPDEAYEQAFLMDDFLQAVSHLPERCRAIFLMSRFHDLRYEEIADSLGISLQTVKNQMNKAIAVLRRTLAHHLE